MPDLEVKQEITATPVDVILLEFDDLKELLQSLCTKTKALIEDCMADAKIRCQSIQVRVKRREKLRDKYINPAKNYKQLADITDLAGLRIITYYEDEVDHVADVIKREFDIDSRSVDKREGDSEKFGYRAANYVCRHLSKRTGSVEYKKFSDLCFEVQVSSILNHAWAEMEHEWYDLRDAYPPQIKRRLARMAALLEVAESEFLAMRKEKSDHQKSISIAVAAKVEEVRLDSSSLVSFIESNKTVARIDQRIADLTGKSLSETSDSSAIAAEAAACLAANINTIEQLRTLLAIHEDAIVEYIESLESRPRSSAKRNPYIAIGACLFHLAIIMISGNTDRERVVQTIKKHYNTGVDVELIAEVAGAIAQKYSLYAVE